MHAGWYAFLKSLTKLVAGRPIFASQNTDC
jgi:hypothetical protein